MAFARIASLTVDIGGPSYGGLASAIIDTTNGYAYFGSDTVPGKILKIRLSDFTKISELVLDYPGEDRLLSAVIDTVNGYAYFGSYSSGKIIKIRLSDLTRVSVLDTGYALVSAVIDTANGYAYFTTETPSGIIIKIRLSDFSIVDTLTSDVGWPWSSVIDTVNGYAYFGTDTDPGMITKVRLSDFTKVGTLTYSRNLTSAVIDTTNGYTYFGSYTVPGEITKIRLSDFSIVDTLILNPGEDNLTNAVIDTIGGFAYFAASYASGPGRVIKIRLSDFSRADSITFHSGENGILSAIIDTANEYTYFGTDTFPGIIVKVDMSPTLIPWPKFHRDIKNTGKSPFANVSTSGIVKWTFQELDYINASPAIGPDETIYIGGSDGNFYATNPDGTQKWKLPLGATESCPAIDADGTIYIPLSSDLYAINPDGTLKWASPFYTPGGYETSPTIGPDGTIYIGSNDNRLYAVNPDGTEKWSYILAIYKDVKSVPAIGDNNTIYFSADDGNLYALIDEGDHATLKWAYFGGWYSPFYSSPIIGSDGTIYIGYTDVYNDIYLLAAIADSGNSATLKWSYAIPTIDHPAQYSTPAISTDGTIYTCVDNYLYAITDSVDHATLEWTYLTGGKIFSSPAIDANNTIYFGCEDGNLYAINSDGTLKWTYLTGSIIFSSSPAIGADGTIYIGSQDWKLHALRSETLTCPTSLKYSGDTVTLQATPKDGIGPYHVEFLKDGSLIDSSRLVDEFGNPNASNPIDPTQENIQITRIYTLDDADIAGSDGTITFGVFISDKCPTGAQTCTENCIINIGCIAPVCNFTVT